MSLINSNLSIAKVEVLPDQSLLVTISGDWYAHNRLPIVTSTSDTIRIVAEKLGDFDSSLPAWIYGNFRKSSNLDISALPSRLQSLVLMAESKSLPSSQLTNIDFLENLGNWGLNSGSSWACAIDHIGQLTNSFVRLIRGSAKVNWSDFRLQLQTSGVDALPIVALLGFLTGLIMAYVGLIQLRQVGATVFVANLVSLSMTREMGPLMTGIIACSRTSTSFASQLASMHVNQETDALRALGINPVEYLGIPRILAVTLMIPLLAVFATLIGILGGMVVACTGDLSVEQFLTQAVRAVNIESFIVGIIKSTSFGFIAAWAGCYRGAAARSSALGVGEAATSAAVLGITLIVVADAIFAVIFNLFNL